MWYSLKFPNFDLQIVVIPRLINGELNCLSSEPRSKNEYFLNFKLNFLNVSNKAKSEREFLYYDKIHEKLFSSPTHEIL